MAWLAQRAFAVLVAVSLTLAVFLILPFMQAIAEGDKQVMLIPVDNFVPDRPPPPPEPEEEPEPEENEPEPPKLAEESQPLDLSQLELALNPGFGGSLTPDFKIDLGSRLTSDGEGGVDEIFSLADLDQKPRVIFQRPPTYPQELRRAGEEGTVYVLFTVNRQGRVQNAKAQKTTNPKFDTYAVDAVRQWKFEPGTRGGQKVQFRMRIPITFHPD